MMWAYIKPTPCYKCEKRHYKCHASCKEYIDFCNKRKKAYYARQNSKNPSDIARRLDSDGMSHNND